MLALLCCNQHVDGQTILLEPFQPAELLYCPASRQVGLLRDKQRSPVEYPDEYPRHCFR